MLKVGDNKELSDRLIEKQKSKGTYDSPCMSVCNYEGSLEECATCLMRKSEKQLWKTGNPNAKSTILEAVKERMASCE